MFKYPSHIAVSTFTTCVGVQGDTCRNAMVCVPCVWCRAAGTCLWQQRELLTLLWIIQESSERAPKCFKSNEKPQFNQRYLTCCLVIAFRCSGAGQRGPRQQGAVLGRGLPRSCPVPIQSPGGRAEPSPTAVPFPEPGSGCCNYWEEQRKPLLKPNF